jgi:hypothetical protein
MAKTRFPCIDGEKDKALIASVNCSPYPQLHKNRICEHRAMWHRETGTNFFFGGTGGF